MTQPLTKCRPEGAAFAPLLGNTVELILLARVWVRQPPKHECGKASSTTHMSCRSTRRRQLYPLTPHHCSRRRASYWVMRIKGLFLSFTGCRTQDTRHCILLKHCSGADRVDGVHEPSMGLRELKRWLHTSGLPWGHEDERNIEIHTPLLPFATWGRVKSWFPYLL